MSKWHQDSGILSPDVVLPAGLEPNFDGFSYDFLEHDFRQINGTGYIASYRILNPHGILDVPAVANCIPVDISRPRRDLGNPGAALLVHTKNGGLGIDFDIHTPDEHIPFIFGHELGHMALFSFARNHGLTVLHDFVHKCKTDSEYKRRVEAVCEFFSGKLQGWIR